MRSAVERAFAPSQGTRRMAVELEMHLAEPVVVPAAWAPYASQEPGGQLELSLPPASSVEGVVAMAESALAAIPGQYALTGVNPWRDLDEVSLVRPTPRYLAMQELFDARGDAGRRMMRLSASLQVCVDLLPGEAGREQWLVANLAGPSLVAAFCPSLERTRIWQGIDPARTAYDGRHLDLRDPVSSYTSFAEGAARLPIPEADHDDYHLGSVFPPVRPRGGYLELRYLDSQPVTAELLGTIWTLLYDDRARREALELLTPTLPDYWDRWTTADADELLAVIDRKAVAA